MHSFQLAIKRLFDIILCLAITVLCLPLFVLVAVLVKLSSPGSVFFVQERVGMKQKPFRMIKFRTMTGRPLKESLVWTEAEEARITPLGRFLRDYGLDELPQVLNILKGDMSIIGPRPPLPAQVDAYTDRQRKVFQMRPGVLSLAAIKGRRSISVEERIDLHVNYVENWSLSLDWAILWRSLFVVCGRQNASERIVTQTQTTTGIIAPAKDEGA